MIILRNVWLPGLPDEKIKNPEFKFQNLENSKYFLGNPEKFLKGFRVLVLTI